MIAYFRSTHRRPAIEQQDELRPGAWVRSERPNDDEKQLLVNYGIDEGVLTDALDPHEVPRIEHDDGWTYFITRVPDVGDDFNDYTTPILFALGKGKTVTLSRDPLGRLWQPFIERTRVDTGNQTELFLTMIEMILQSYQTRVAAINRQMRAATSDIVSLNPKDIATFVEYERKLNDYLDALIPTNTALEKTLNSKFKLITLKEEDQEMVEDLSVDIEQVIARCKSLLRTITNLRDSYRAVMDTRLNETIRLLTVVTLTFTVPTMFAGLYGMNVDLPGEHAPYMFWIVIVVSFVVAGSLGFYFLRKR